MLSLSSMITASLFDEDIKDEIVYEEDCKDFIAYSDQAIEQKHLFSNLEKFTARLDEKAKFYVHKFLTEHIHKLANLKTKTLLPCYIVLHYLSMQDITLSVQACRYLFGVDIKYNKIDRMFSILNKITGKDVTFNRSNFNGLIKGWCYVMHQLDLYEQLRQMVVRIYIFEVR